MSLCVSSEPLESDSGSLCADLGPHASWAAISLVVLMVAGGVIASLIVSGQFNSTGWLRHTAFPAIKEAFENFGNWVNETVIPAVRRFLETDLGQVLIYWTVSVVGLGILGLGIKYRTSIKAAYNRLSCNPFAPNLDNLKGF